MTDIQSVLFETKETTSGHAIAIMTLNDPKSLNALSVDMCKLMNEQLTKWQDDDTIVAILLQGSGDKAFCAGGNIRKLYDSMIDKPPFTNLLNPSAEEFFSSEYRLFQQMHFYSKPIVLWGNGIVMGGGMGLMAMCSHRVVTDTTRFAMPEISIGLYPDATGSWLLQRMPAKSGLFLGLTAANCNGADAILANMAEFALSSQDYDSLLESLTKAKWVDNAGTLNNLHDTTSNALSQIHRSDHLAKSNLATHWQLINKIVSQGSIEQIDLALQDLAVNETYSDDKWVTRAISSYQHGSPVSAALTFEVFKRAAGLSLEEVLYMEMNLSLHCANNPDFREGVRALLIDKDRSPKWSRTLKECAEAQGQSYIASHFVSPYKAGKHPFASWLSQDSQGAKRVQVRT